MKTELPKKLLSDRVVRALKPAGKPYIQWDSSGLKFGVKVNPGGRKVFVLHYDTLEGQSRKYVLGKWPSMDTPTARVRCKEVMAQVWSGGDPAHDKIEARTAMTYNELYALYRDYIEPRRRASTNMNDALRWKKHILPVFGNKKVRDTRAYDAQSFHTSMKETPGAANLCISAMAACVSFGLKNELISLRRNYFSDVEKYNIKARDRFLSKEEVSRLGSAMRSVAEENPLSCKVICAMEMLILTGCRVSEILSLRKDDVLPDTRQLRLRRTKTEPLYKNVSKEAIELAMIMKTGDTTDNPYLFPGKYEGTHISKGALQYYIKKVKDESGITDFMPHTFRHTFATHSTILGCGLDSLMHIMNHKNTNTTKGYVHSVPDHIREKISNTGSHIRSYLNQGVRGEHVTV